MALELWQSVSRILLMAVMAFALTFVLTPVVRMLALRFGLVAAPVEDRWGRRVTARLGGVAIFLGFTGTALFWVPLAPPLPTLLMGSALVFALGLWDDLRRLPPYTKLIVQLLIGSLVVAGGIRIELIQWVWLSIPLSVIWFVLIMNAFNLLDNMDGLAAGIGALAAGFCAYHAAISQQWLVVSLSIMLVGACLGFLRFNFPPAKIYMGDSGSHFLGLTLAMLALLGTWRRSTQLLSVLAIPVLVLAVPIFDTCFVTIQRLAHGQHPFTGGKDHVSHRLAILGLSARQTAMVLYGMSALLGVVSVISADLNSLHTLAIWLFIVTVLILVGRYLSRVNVYRVERKSESVRGSDVAKTTLIETMLLHKRRLVEILVDFSLVSVCYVAAHLLRFEGVLSANLHRLILQSLPIIIVIKLACFAWCGLYRGVWRYLGLADLTAIGKAVTLGSLLSSVALLYLWRFAGYSRAVLVIDWMLLLLTIGGSRIIERLLDEWIHAAAKRTISVLIVGAGDTGERVLRYLKYEGRGNRWVLGFLDDDAHKKGSRIHGISVLGGRGKLPELLDTHQVHEVLVAINDPPGDLLQFIQRLCEPKGISWKVVSAGITDAV